MRNESKNAQQLHKKRESTYQLVNEYHKKFIDENTGRIYNHMKEERNCPVCNSSSYTKIFDKSASTYMKCNDCTMVFLNPILNQKAIKDYYINLNTGQGDIVSNERDFYIEIYMMGLNRIEKYREQAGSLLDIGCSTGFFLDIAKGREWRTSGIELGIIEAAKAQNNGHNIYMKTIDQIDIQEKFDVITMWDVLEHVPNGIDQLNHIKNHLNEKGILFFQIPNSDSFAAKIMRESCRMFDGLEHTNLYNPKTIDLLAEKSGYKVLNIKSVISEIAVINNYLDFSDPYYGKSQYKDKVINLLDEEFINKNKIGYKLQVTLQKK